MNLEGKNWCYYIPEAQDPTLFGGYVPSLVIENEPGHSPMLGQGPCSSPWVWGKTLDHAQQVCAATNAKRGITEERALEIVMSSIGASMRTKTFMERGRR
jgi:hypothetical protein